MMTSSDESTTDAPLPAPTTCRTRAASLATGSASGSRSISRLSSGSSSLSSSHDSGLQDVGVGLSTDRQSGKRSASLESVEERRKKRKTGLSPPAAGKGKGKAVDESGQTNAAVQPEFIPEETLHSAVLSVTPRPALDPLSSYSCPICFSPPTNATLTPCGHICCGSCLFTAVKTTLQRTQILAGEHALPRCPVCRALIPGWDGRGGGVIGLKTRAVFTL